MSKHSTIVELIDFYDKSVDNDSLLYMFNTGFNLAIDRDSALKHRVVYINQNDNETFSLFNNEIRPNMDKVKNILYKNLHGKWIKIFQLLRDNPYIKEKDVFEYANDEEIYPYYIIDKFYIPELKYVSKNTIVYPIADKDNSKNYSKKIPIYIDEMDKKQIKLSQFSLENPNYGFELRHMMDDLRIEIKDEDIGTDNLLVTLNGLFVETLKMSQFPNSLFIKNARWIYRTISGGLKNGVVSKPGNNIGLTADKYFDESDFLKIYSIDVKIFKWHGVNITEWLHPQDIAYDLVFAEYKNVRIVKSLTFNKKLDPNRTLIFCNGVIMDPFEYTMEDNRVNFKFLKAEFHRLYYEFKEKKLKNPLGEVLNFINRRYYSAVEFSDVEGNELFLRYSTPLTVGIMGYNSVLFSEPPTSNDFILVDGVNLKHEIVPNGTIKFPKYYGDTLFYREDVYPFKERRIIKLELVNWHMLNE